MNIDNKTFDFQRFMRYLKLTWIENKNKPISKITIILGLWLIGILFKLLNISDVWAYRFDLFSYAMAWTFFAIFPAYIASCFANKKSTFNTLIKPASNLEKYLSRVVVFWFLPMIVSVFATLILPHLSETVANETLYQNGELKIYIDNTKLSWANFRLIFNLLLIISGIYAVGGMFFKKKSILFTTLIIVALTIINVYGIVQFLKNHANDNLPWLNSVADFFRGENHSYRITLLQFAISLPITFVCGVLAYKGFKKRQLK